MFRLIPYPRITPWGVCARISFHSPFVNSTIKYCGAVNTYSRLSDLWFRPFYARKRTVQAVSERLQANSGKFRNQNATGGKGFFF